MLSARPRRHAQAPKAIEEFKTASPGGCTKVVREKAVDVTTIEIWLQDLEQPTSPLENYAQRATRLSAQVLINETYY